MSDFPPREIVFDIRVTIPNDEFYEDNFGQVEDALDELRDFARFEYPSDPINVVTA